MSHDNCVIKIEDKTNVSFVTKGCGCPGQLCEKSWGQGQTKGHGPEKENLAPELESHEAPKLGRDSGDTS